MSTLHSSASSHLRIDGVSVRFCDRHVLTNVSLTVSTKERVGLIGENGSGKSTLLKIAAGLLTPDAGSVTYTTDSSEAIGLLHQEPPFARGSSVRQALESAVKPARDAVATINLLASRMAEVPSDSTISEAYASALADADRLDAWSTDAHIATTLAGLGLGKIDVNKPISELSGGEQARLSLAWLLLSSPRILLLDEPTNHLDDHAAEFLKRTLLNWQGPVLIASHDRSFLDDITTATIDLDPTPETYRNEFRAFKDERGTTAGVTKFTGTYSDYVQMRAESRARWELQYRDEQSELKQLRSSVQANQQVGHRDWRPRSESKVSKKFYSDRNATVVARRVNDARARLESLESRQIAKPPTELAFSGMVIDSHNESCSDSDPLDTDQILAVSNLSLQHQLEAVSFNLDRYEKVLITGPNGAGKSTLLKLIASQLSPTSGSVAYQNGTQIGLLTQEAKIPDPYDHGDSRTAAETYIEAIGSGQVEKVPLSTFGLLHPNDEKLSIGSLSVGQRKRLELAIILAQSPDLLLLDEPTNHLSLSLVTALEQEIPRYPGAVIVASHDHWLRQHWNGRRIELGL